MNKPFGILLFFVAAILTAFVLADNYYEPYSADETQVIASPFIEDTIVLDTSYKLAKKALPERDALAVAFPSRYTYTYYNDPEVKDHLRENDQAPSPVTVTKRMPQPTTLPPIFERECMTAVNPTDCSQRRLDQYFTKVMLDNGFPKTYQDTLMTSFVIDEYGTINGPITVEGQTNCMECKAILIKTISNMEDWSAAVKNNQPIKVKVVLPVVL